MQSSSKSAHSSWPILFFSLFFPSLVAWLYFVVLAPPDLHTPPGFVPLLVYAIGKTIQFGLPIVRTLVIEQRRTAFSKPTWAGLPSGIAFGLLTALCIVLLYQMVFHETLWFKEAPTRVAAKLTLFHADTPARFLVLALFLSLIHSFLEEYYWRWFVYRELTASLSNWQAIALSSIGFMGHHIIILSVYFPLTPSLLFSAGVAIGGAVWAWIYQRSGSLLGPWLSHALVDAAIMLVGYQMVFG